MHKMVLWIELVLIHVCDMPDTNQAYRKLLMSCFGNNPLLFLPLPFPSLSHTQIRSPTQLKCLDCVGLSYGGGGTKLFLKINNTSLEVVTDT